MEYDSARVSYSEYKGGALGSGSSAAGWLVGRLVDGTIGGSVGRVSDEGGEGAVGEMASMREWVLELVLAASYDGSSSSCSQHELARCTSEQSGATGVGDMMAMSRACVSVWSHDYIHQRSVASELVAEDR